MSTPAGIGICNQDNTISYIIVSDNGWIKDGIGDTLIKYYSTEKSARDMIEHCTLPDGYFPLYDLRAQKATAEYLFMKQCLLLPRCYVFYTYLWKNGPMVFPPFRWISRYSIA